MEIQEVSEQTSSMRGMRITVFVAGQGSYGAAARGFDGKTYILDMHLQVCQVAQPRKIPCRRRFVLWRAAV